MAIYVNLDRILLERDMTLTDLSERVGISLPNLSILKTNKARAVRFSTLSALCSLTTPHCFLICSISHRPTQTNTDSLTFQGKSVCVCIRL